MLIDIVCRPNESGKQTGRGRRGPQSVQNGENWPENAFFFANYEGVFGLVPLAFELPLALIRAL